MCNLVCIGAGRLAYHLMPQLEAAGCHVRQVYNRTEDAAISLAERLTSASFTSDIKSIRRDADFYFLTVADDAVKLISRQMHLNNPYTGIFVHCSGILSLDALPFEKRGVFYPLQSFSVPHPVPWLTTPILITSDQKDIKEKLLALAHKISQAVYEVTDEQKSILHLAAVFANNFTNHMLTLAEKICLEHQVSFDILKPLIRETVEKALDTGPSLSQTGPAVRGDQETIEKHLALISQDQTVQEIYRLMTKSIGQG